MCVPSISLVPCALPPGEQDVGGHRERASKRRDHDEARGLRALLLREGRPTAHNPRNLGIREGGSITVIQCQSDSFGAGVVCM